MGGEFISDETVNLHGFNIKAGRLSKSLVADYLQCNDTETTLILICGTLKFNQSMKEWLLFNVQWNKKSFPCSMDKGHKYD